MKNFDSSIIGECIRLAHQGITLIFNVTSDQHSLGLAYLNAVSIERLLFSSHIDVEMKFLPLLGDDVELFDNANHLVTSGDYAAWIDELGSSSAYDFRIGLNAYFCEILSHMSSEASS